MKSDEQKVLSSSGIHTGYKTVGEYRIYLEWQDGYQTVKFRVEETARGRYEFSQSHFIKTPLQAASYRTSRTSEDNPDYALLRVVDTVMSHYNEAVKAGHTPSEEWFEPNEDF